MKQDSETLAPSTRAIYAGFDYVDERKRLIVILLLAVAITAFLASGIYIVKKEERAVLTRFGKVVDENILPGIHYAFPLVDKAYLRKVTRIVNQNVMTRGEGEQASFSILSGDANLFEASVALQYRIDDLRSWLFETTDPEAILTLVVRERLIDVMGRNYIDLIFSNNRDIIQTHLHKEVSAWLENADIGIELLTLNIVELRPIEETVAAFRDVNDAISESLQQVNSAQRRTEQMLARSRGRAEAIVLNAQGRAVERQLQAEASAAAFRDLLDTYRGESASVVVTRYWQRMRTILKDATISAVGPGETAAIDINMIDGYVPGVRDAPGVVTPGVVGRESLVASRRWLPTEEERDNHLLSAMEEESKLIFGRVHAARNERHHLGIAQPESLLFDDLAVFGHRDIQQTGISQAAEQNEPPMTGQAGQLPEGYDADNNLPTVATPTGDSAQAADGSGDGGDTTHAQGTSVSDK